MHSQTDIVQLFVALSQSMLPWAVATECCNKCCVMQKSVFTMALMTLRNCNLTAIERWKFATVHKLLAFQSVHHHCLPTYSVTRVPCTMSSAACRPCPFLPASKILKIQQPLHALFASAYDHCYYIILTRSLHERLSLFSGSDSCVHRHRRPGYIPRVAVCSGNFWHNCCRPGW